MRNRTRVGSGQEDLFLELVRGRLREFGIAVEVEREASALAPDGGVDAVVALSRGDASAAYSVQVKSPMTLTSVARGRVLGSRPLLVVGDQITKRSADAFREADIQFVDTLGNAFITFDGVYVDVRGRAEPAAPGQVTRGRESANMFSRGRSQVILALLAWPELVEASRREVAKAAGTSLGQAHEVLTRLGEAGFLLSHARKLIRSDVLLDLWSAAYPAGLGPRLEIAGFIGDPARSLKSDRPLYLSGESAEGLDIVRPASLTVYVDSMDSKLAIANRWSTDPERVRNVFVRRKFWTSPRPESEEFTAGIGNAPWPLVYADLLAAGDARLDEVAATWRSDRAGPGSG
ncbi:MAG TPA: type IV toxin-antitoxin system AbiEi family antitoxin [Actinoplanes sp.]|nr:type IV toxin-antitoxin system AbiEi family antitoxin [Actinoplanes sp.]